MVQFRRVRVRVRVWIVRRFSLTSEWLQWSWKKFMPVWNELLNSSEAMSLPNSHILVTFDTVESIILNECAAGTVVYVSFLSSKIPKRRQ